VVQDDSRIDNADVVFRWNAATSHQLTPDHRRGCWRLSSGSLILHGDGLSVYVDSVLRTLGLGPETVLAECRGDSVWALDVAVIRDLGCGLVMDPASDGFSVDPAHALLTIDPDLGRSARKRVLRGLVVAARLVAGDVPAWPPPDD
jgi:hypothetical protein